MRFSAPLRFALLTSTALAPSMLATAAIFAPRPSLAQPAPQIVAACNVQSLKLGPGTWYIDQAGNLCVSGGGGGGGGTSSNFAATFPTAGTAAGFKQGSTMAAGTLDGSGNLDVNVNAGAVAATQSGVWTNTLAAGAATIGAVDIAAGQSLSATLVAGAAIAGKFGIDQTTPGTTNGIVINAGTFAVGAFVDGALATMGAKADTAAASGTITASEMAVLKGILIAAQSTIPAGSNVGSVDSLNFGFVAGTSAELSIVATTTTTTAQTLLPAAVGLHSYLTSVICTRGDAGTVAVAVTIGATISPIVYVPNSSGGGGFTARFVPPIVSSNTNTAITMTAGSAVSTLSCTGLGYSGTEILNTDIPTEIQPLDLFDLNNGLAIG
jgi:hypothetical protein